MVTNISTKADEESANLQKTEGRFRSKQRVVVLSMRVTFFHLVEKQWKLAFHNFVQM